MSKKKSNGVDLVVLDGDDSDYGNDDVVDLTGEASAVAAGAKPAAKKRGRKRNNNNIARHGSSSLSDEVEFVGVAGGRKPAPNSNNEAPYQAARAAAAMAHGNSNNSYNSDVQYAGIKRAHQPELQRGGGRLNGNHRGQNYSNGYNDQSMNSLMGGGGRGGSFAA